MNENIVSYIKDQYLSEDSKPQFAVLIIGKWGCGKTYLVRNILKERYGTDKKSQQDNVIMLSLYGLSTIGQLQRKLFEKNHPILTSKLVQFTGKLAKSAVKLSAGLDLNDDKTNDLNLDISFADLGIEDGKTTTQKVIVVDDIERSSIPIEEVLGYFSESIIDSNQHVIFIGNIDEMKEKTSSNDTDQNNQSKIQKQSLMK